MKNWRVVALIDVIELQRGHDLPTATRGKGAVPVIGSFGVTGFHDEARYNGPGVAIGRSGASIGTATYVREPYWPLNTCLFVRDFKGNDPRWVYHLLDTTNFMAFNSGSAQPSLNRNFLRNIPVAIPPVVEQEAIADVLRALDDKIGANCQLAEVAEKLALVEFLKAIQHESYEVVLAEVTSLLARGITPKYAESGQCVVVLNQKCIRDQRVNFEPARTSSRDRLRAEKVLEPDDVLVNSTGQGTLGRVARWTQNREATVDSHVSIVRFDESLIDPVCGGFGVLRLQSVIEQMGEGSTGQTELSRVELGKLRIRLPHREAQTALRSRLGMLGRQSSVQLAENRALVALRDALLPQLMSGKIRVRDVEKTVGEVL